MAYNTNNPVGSKDPRDLYDNATNFDNYSVGPDPFYPNRFGVLKLSIEGQQQAFLSAQEGREDQFQAALASIGYTWLGDYGAGLNFTSRQQYTVRDGIAYVLEDTVTLPYTTTGNWVVEVVNFKALSTDQVLRADLANVADPEKGPALIGYTSEFGSTLRAFLDFLKNGQRIYTPQQGGVQSFEEGGTNPVTVTAAWNSWVASLPEGAQVWVPGGTYIMNQGAQMGAPGTVWQFAQNSLLKLSATQATDDFLVFDRPTNQRLRGMRLDGNRANQDSGTFGIDNCACLVISPDNFLLEQVEVVSSPAKGLAIVSAAGETSRNWTVRGFKGADCQYQVFLVDGNNMTGFFEKGCIDDVKIGTTTGYGLAINDGASDIVVSNVISDVNNTSLDAVYMRDSWDLELTNVVGRRGRNGVQIQSVAEPLMAKRITMNNVIGELSDQSGVLILAAADVNAGTVIGRNNNVVGINVQWSSGVNKNQRITISNPVAYDDRTVPVQTIGLLVAGCQNSSFGVGNQYGNVTSNVSFTASANTNVAFPYEQVQTVSVGDIAASSFLNVTVTWPVPMPDASYFEEAVLEVGTTGLSVALGHANGRVAGQVSFMVRNLTASSISAGVVTLRAKARRVP